MKLFVSYCSLFVRRVAMTMNIFDIPYEHVDLPIFENPDPINVHNPLTRVPTLLLDDGEVLIESYAWLHVQLEPWIKCSGLFMKLGFILR